MLCEGRQAAEGPASVRYDEAWLCACVYIEFNSISSPLQDGFNGDT